LKRIRLVLEMAAVMVAITVPVGPAFAKAGQVEGLPEGGCPTEGGFVETTRPIPPGSEGNFTLVNDTPEQCFKPLSNFPDNPPLPINPEIQIEDNLKNR
jgi:hypothetical protein